MPTSVASPSAFAILAILEIDAKMVQKQFIPRDYLLFQKIFFILLNVIQIQYFMPFSRLSVFLEIKWVEFGQRSFIEYLMKVPRNSHTTKVNVLFAPGSTTTGELGYGKSSDVRKYISTSIDGSYATAKFDLDSAAINQFSTSQTQLQVTVSIFLVFSSAGYFMQLFQGVFLVAS